MRDIPCRQKPKIKKRRKKNLAISPIKHLNTDYIYWGHFVCKKKTGNVYAKKKSFELCILLKNVFKWMHIITINHKNISWKLWIEIEIIFFKCSKVLRFMWKKLEVKIENKRHNCSEKTEWIILNLNIQQLF